MNLKIQDLRIGNYIDCFGEKKIKSIQYIATNDSYLLMLSDKNGINENCWFHSLDIKPIEITREKLLEIGFREIFDSGKTTDFFELNVSNSFSNFSYSLKSKKITIMHDENYISHILNNEFVHLHFLQNMFNDLHQYELTK